jgi:hypothetical protein
LSVNLRPELDQLAHARRALAHGDLDRVAPAQPGPGDERVLDVVSKSSSGVPHRRDAALRVGRVGLGGVGLGDDDDAAVFGGLEREPQPGHPGPEHEEVDGIGHAGLRRAPVTSALVTPARAGAGR